MSRLEAIVNAVGWSVDALFRAPAEIVYRGAEVSAESVVDVVGVLL